MQFGHYGQFSELRHGVFTRWGGYSKTPYEGLNASFSTGDALENVVRNRLLVLQSLGIEAYPCATLWQVHGADVATIDTESAVWDDWRDDWPHRSYWGGEQELVWTIKTSSEGDGLIKRRRGVTRGRTFDDFKP